MPWSLAIDFGTTSTAAAVARDGGAQLVLLDGGLPRMLSNVFLQESTGRLLLGDVADNAAVLAPWCLDRTPKRRLGQEFMWLGDHRVRVADAVGEVLRRVTADATRLQGGEPPSAVRLTHPVRSGSSARSALLEAAQVAGLREPELVLEPVAAAMHYARLRLETGEFVAVYDLGGGTFDTAVLQRVDGDFRVVGTPAGREDIGGEAFDDRLYEYLGQQLPPEQWVALRSPPAEDDDNTWPRANRQFQRNIRRAKELLTNYEQVDVLVPPPVNRDLPLTAQALNNLIRRDIEQTVAELERTIRSANLTPSALSAMYLAGGSSQIPLVGEMIEQRLGVTARHLDDPKAVICLGAALRPLGRQPEPEPPPEPERPPEPEPQRPPEPERPTEPRLQVPSVTRQPEVVGQPQAGRALEVAAFHFSGPEPLSIAYQWQRRDGSGRETYIPGATGPRLELSDEHTGTLVRLLVTATNTAGTATSASAWTGPVTHGYTGPSVPDGAGATTTSRGFDAGTIPSVVGSVLLPLALLLPYDAYQGTKFSGWNSLEWTARVAVIFAAATVLLALLGRLRYTAIARTVTSALVLGLVLLSGITEIATANPGLKFGGYIAIGVALVALIGSLLSLSVASSRWAHPAAPPPPDGPAPAGFPVETVGRIAAVVGGLAVPLVMLANLDRLVVAGTSFSISVWHFSNVPGGVALKVILVGSGVCAAAAAAARPRSLIAVGTVAGALVASFGMIRLIVGLSDASLYHLEAGTYLLLLVGLLMVVGSILAGQPWRRPPAADASAAP